MYVYVCKHMYGDISIVPQSIMAAGVHATHGACATVMAILAPAVP